MDRLPIDKSLREGHAGDKSVPMNRFGRRRGKDDDEEVAVDTRYGF